MKDEPMAAGFIKLFRFWTSDPNSELSLVPQTNPGNSNVDQKNNRAVFCLFPHMENNRKFINHLQLSIRDLTHNLALLPPMPNRIFTVQNGFSHGLPIR
jgi:hypothetical protein